MRLLPQSAKGTWLLAAAVWVVLGAAACALPAAKPHAIVRLPVDSDVVGLGPAAETAIVHRFAWHSNQEEPTRQDLELYSVASGQLLGTLLERCGRLDTVGQSGDGQTYVFLETGIPAPRLLRLDVPTRTIQVLAVDPAQFSFSGGRAVSADGRFCVLADDKATSLVLWDIRADCQYAALPGLKPPYAFSADGRAFVAMVANSPEHQISVFDITTLATRRTFTIPPDPKWEPPNRVGLSDDGSYIAAEQGSHSIAFISKTLCWNVATGRLCFGGKGANGAAGVPVGRATLIAETDRDSDMPSRLQWVDLENGRVTASTPLDPHAPWEVSPDGQLVVLWTAVGYLGDRVNPNLFDAQTGRPLGTLPADRSRGFYLENRWRGAPIRWAQGGQFIAIGHARPNTTDLYGLWDIWQVPRSQRWPPTAVAGLLALLAAFVACVRTWQLRREAA